jgi:hemoglobin
MKLTRTLLLALALGTSSLLVPAHGAPQPDYYPPAGELNKVCPVTGKPADPSITTEYEGRTYAFADKESCAKWKSDRENSLYQKLGGQVAIDAAVERFYVKMLADDRVKHVFDDVNMNLQRRKQKRFLSAAFGGPIPWTGLDMRKAHEGLHLTEAHFQAVAENLQSTLEDLKVPKELIAQVMAIAGSVHDDVLNKPKAATK